MNGRTMMGAALMVMLCVAAVSCRQRPSAAGPAASEQIVPAAAVPAALDCPKDRVKDVGGVEVSRLGAAAVSLPSSAPAAAALFFKSGLMIDEDGAPDAYGPGGKGISALANAGKPGNWWGVVTDNGRADGEPVVQGPDDPYPGYFISTTSLQDKTKDVRDPARYVDAMAVPYVALPSGLGAMIGDVAAVINTRSGKLAYAIFADVGPRDKLGEGSAALAAALGIKADTGGLRSSAIIYVVFPGSGDKTPRPISWINSEGARLFQEWGGMERADACFP